MRQRGHGTRRALHVVAVAALTVGVAPVPSAAQEVGEPIEIDEGDGTADEMVLLDERLHLPDGAFNRRRDLHGLIMWPEGRRAYQILSTSSADEIAAIDLDTFEEVTRSEFAPPFVSQTPSLANNDSRAVNRANVAVDHDTGRLFIPYAIQVHNQQAPCGHAACLGGVYVVDGRTLEEKARLPFRPVGVDGATVAAYVTAMTYSPSLTPGGRGKLHLLLIEGANHVGLGLDYAHRQRGFAQTWALQVDVETGRHDWMVRLGACNGERHNDSTFGAHSVVFRTTDDPTKPEVYAGCYRSGNGGAIVRLHLDPDDEDAPPLSQESFVGPGAASRYIADRPAKRILIEAGRGDTTRVWWVFDGDRSGFVGVLGSAGQPDQVAAGFDETTGRLYLLTTPKSTRLRGVLVADMRRSDLAQAVPMPHLHEAVHPDPLKRDERWANNYTPVVIDPAGPGRPTRVFLRPGNTAQVTDFYHVVADHRPVSQDPPPADVSGRTHDVAEVEGLTAVDFTGAARGYGLRTMWIGGLSGARMEADGNATDNYRTQRTAGAVSPCLPMDREVALGMVGSYANAGVLEPSRAAADAIAAVADNETVRDLAEPDERCVAERLRTGTSYIDGPLPLSLTDGTWAALRDMLTRRDTGPVRVPADAEPGQAWEFAHSSCAAPGFEPGDEHGQAGDESSPVLALATEVRCIEGAGLFGRSSARLAAAGLVSVADAASTFEIEPLPGGGVVGRVRSVARGIEIEGAEGVVRIDAVEAEAVAWATGRRAVDTTGDEPEGLDALLGVSDCVVPTSGSGTCYTQRFVGVRAGDFRCGPCHGREEQMAAAMSAALGAEWTVRVRHPEPSLANGSEDGYAAGILKSPSEQFTDANIMGDLLPTLPALEMVRTTDIPGNRGRQIFLFAGVEVSTVYGITCLATIIEGECVNASQPGSIEVSLTDTDGQPLAGAVFEVHADGSGDVLGSIAALSSGGTCVTGPAGTCTFSPLDSGSYLVRQKVAPPGYDPAPDVPVFLPEGGTAFVNLVNARNTAGIGIVLLDDQEPPQPLAGGVFDVYAAGGNPALGTGELLLASCTTDVSGGCLIDTSSLPDVVDVRPALAGLPPVLDVPLGGYTIRQAAAPEGYVPADDVSFELTQPGQLAQVTFRNGRVAAAGGQVEPLADPGVGEVFEGGGPVEIVDAAPAAPPMVTVEGGRARQPRPAVAAGPPDSGLQRFLQLPVAALSLLTRNPKDAAAFGGLVLLFAAAAAGAWRRRMLSYVIGK